MSTERTILAIILLAALLLVLNCKFDPLVSDSRGMKSNRMDVQKGPRVEISFKTNSAQNGKK